MKLRIDYRAEYHYEKPVSLSPHIVRIFPRADLFVHVERKEFATLASADVQFRRDISDNLVARCFYPENAADLTFELHMDLDVAERNPFHFLLDQRALNLPCAYTPSEQAVLAAFLRFNQPLALHSPLAPDGQRPTVETLVAMNQWIHENIAYERRDEGDPFEPAETLRRGAASCRDVAVLLAEVLRLNGVAARLASGFVWEGDREDGERRAESAMHAWTEAYLPGAGWIGLDPTNGALTDHHFITTAVGLEPADVSPVSGTYFGKEFVASTLSTALEVRRP